MSQRARKRKQGRHDGRSPQTPQAVKRPTRAYEVLTARGRLTREQDAAAQTLRDDYERAGLVMDTMRAAAYEAAIAGGDGAMVANEGAWRRYLDAMGQLAPVEAAIVRRYVIEDRAMGADPATIRRLSLALDRLAWHYGIRTRVRGTHERNT